jgi:hypothetical protein
MNTADLSRWATRAAADLRSYADAAAEAGTPQPETEALISELDDIFAGRPVWQWRLAERESNASALEHL